MRREDSTQLNWTGLYRTGQDQILQVYWFQLLHRCTGAVQTGPQQRLECRWTHVRRTGPYGDSTAKEFPLVWRGMDEIVPRLSADWQPDSL